MDGQEPAVQLPLVVIVGPTASGKTALAVRLASHYNGEIICADSRTVYRGMDIGTAKPTAEERALVPHWGLDLVEPGEGFSAADFKAYATATIDQIRARGAVPFLVGGTGLYVDGVVFDYQFGVAPDAAERAGYMALTAAQLQQLCRERGLALPANPANKRHLVRLLEQKGTNNRRRQRPLPGTIIVGIATERDVLRQRIAERAEHIFDHAVAQEAKTLGTLYGWDSEAMTGNIYPIMQRYLCGEIDAATAREHFFYRDWHLAKRQLTWLRRNPFITWLGLDEAEQFLAQKLAKKQSP